MTGTRMTPKNAPVGELAEQANVRLTRDEHDVLQALIFVQEVAGSSEILRPVVTQFLHKQREQEEVRLALHARATGRAKGAGKVSQLRPRVGSKKSPR
jgi:hypothetical protein